MTNKLKGKAPAYRYCPLHEWDVSECDEWCLPRRIEMKVLDDKLRYAFKLQGYYRRRAGHER